MNVQHNAESDDSLARAATSANRRYWMSRLAHSPVSSGRVIAKFAWHNYLAWPAPVWRSRGFATIPLAGVDCRFSTRGMNAPVNVYRMMRSGGWEPALLDVARTLAGNCSVAFDVGAWAGPYSILLSKSVSRGGGVVAFEPDPVARSELSKNVRLNVGSAIEVLPYAVADREGSVAIGAETLGRSGSRIGASAGEPAVEVPMVTLDGLCEKISLWPEFVKMDIEGAEVQAFAGGAKVINRSKSLMVELHPHLIKRPERELPRILGAMIGSGKRVMDENGRALVEGDGDGIRARTHVVAMDESLTSLRERVQRRLARGAGAVSSGRG